MVKINRWLTLAAGCLVQASSGLNYSFSIIAPLFKTHFGYNDMQLATLAVAINLGGYSAFISGYAYDYLSTRHNLGPRLIIWAGCVMTSLGYGCMWAMINGYMVESYSRMILYAVVAGNGSTWWDTSALVTNVRNFPDDRGSVMGICKAFIGMSTSIYASMYLGLFATPSAPALPNPTTTHSTPAAIPATSSYEWQHMRRTLFPTALLQALGTGTQGLTAFLGVLAIVPSTLNFIGSLFINHVPVDYHEPNETDDDRQVPSSTHYYTELREHVHEHVPRVNKARRLTGLYILVAVVAVLQAGSTLAAQGQPPGAQNEKLHAYLLLGLLGLILLVPVSTGPMARQSLRRRRYHDVHTDAIPHDTEFSVTGPNNTDKLPPPLDAASDPPVHYPPVVVVGGCEGARNGGDALSQSHMFDATTTTTTHVLVKKPATTPAVAPDPQEQESVNLAGHKGDRSDVEEAWSPLLNNQQDKHSCYSVSDSQGDLLENEAPPIRNLTPGQAMSFPTFWALFFIFMSACACGLTLLNNLVPLVLALGGVPGGQVAFVSLFSVANASGRLLFGHFSEFWLHKSGLPRTVFLLSAVCLMSICMAILAAGAPLHALYGLSMATGFAFGGHWSSVPAVASDLFGLGNFAGIYCILQIASAVGAILFSSYLCGRNLQQETRRQGGSFCVGPSCFRPTWYTLLALQGLSLAIGVWLWRNTRQSYRQAVHKTRSQNARGL